ncbi:cytochrome P450 CYP82D47-like [Cornus florida]|uniref:cytochrome P450 CYP82D47-like n=1 Tax=Cornus florida TaxID=4283 RepID=UPI0028A054D4|nr:cytochrome P450 CYP82D47-like [Cornus florida]
MNCDPLLLCTCSTLTHLYIQSQNNPNTEKSITMESFLPMLPTIVRLSIYPLLFVVCFVIWRTRVGHGRNTASKKRLAPQATGALPLIGHLHLLGRSQLPHITLGSMADKYGPIFTIKLGLNRALVVSDWEMAKECFTTNDKVFANRPSSLAVELMTYNYAMFGLGPYGDNWRKAKKIVMHELLSNRALDMLRHIRVSEVRTSIREVYDLWVKKESTSNVVKLEMKQWFANFTLNVMVRMLVGKRYLSDDEEGAGVGKAITEFFELLGVFVVSDAIPFLRCLDLGGYEKAMKKTAKEMDHIIEGWLQEHKRKRDFGMVKSDQQDFMDVILSLLDSTRAEELPDFDAHTISKATCLGMLTAGTDPTTVTLTWTLSLLMNNRHVLRKVQDEIDVHIGRGRLVEETDVKNLVYLQAVLKETLRLYPPGPLSVPHESTEDCVVGGYNIPKSTRLLVNLWKIHRDPLVWSDPNEFQPERFLTGHKDVDVRGQHFGLIPFGSGRRMCSGISLSLQIMQFTLASLIHGFELGTPLYEPVDMSESFGLTNLKATPLEVLLTPRLPAILYTHDN